MEKNWIIEAAESAVEKNGLVRLENPAIKSKLDNALQALWPEVKVHAAKTTLKLEPELDADIASGEGNVLMRMLSFMLFCDDEPVCRTEIECYTDHWMINNEFFMSLDDSADIAIVQEILGNTRFSGNPPTLMIYKNDPVNHFQITFNAGWGEDWDMVDTSFIRESIEHSIATHAAMYDLVCDGLTELEHAEEFLSTAYEVYETH